MLCAPILDEHGAVIAITSFANKRPPETDTHTSSSSPHAQAGFTADDESVVSTLAALCSVGLRLPFLLLENQQLHQKVGLAAQCFG